MASEIFKILRCRCGWQRWDENPCQDIPPCPKCGRNPTYGRNWYTRVTINGRRKIQSIGPHRRQAETVLKKTQADIITDKYQLEGPPILLLSAAIENVWQDRWRRNVEGERSRAQATAWVEYFGNIPITDINEQRYREAVRAMSAAGRGDVTINRYRAALKTVLRRHRADYSFIEMVSEDDGRIRIITPQEEEIIDTHLRDRSTRHWPNRQNYRDEAADAITVLIDTGMRPGELLHNITPRDVDFVSGLITIWENKTKKPRSVPMTDRVKTILRPRIQAGKTFSLAPYQLNRAWDHVRELMGHTDDPDFVPYACRHTCATRLLQAGVDIYTVKKWLGHKSINTTLRYLHLQPGMLTNAMAAMEAYRQQIINSTHNIAE